MFALPMVPNDEAAHTATTVTLLEKRVDDLSRQLTAVQHMVEDGLTEKMYVVEKSKDRILKKIHSLLSLSKQDMHMSAQELRVSLQQELRDFIKQQEQQHLKDFRDEIDSLREQTKLTDVSLMGKLDAPHDNPARFKDVMATIDRILQEQDRLRQVQEATSREAVRAEIQSMLADIGHPSSSEKDGNMECASRKPNPLKHDESANEGETRDGFVKEDMNVRPDKIGHALLEEHEESYQEEDNLKKPRNTQEVVEKIHMMEDHLQYDYLLNESMWDATVFLGMHILGLGGSIFLGFLWLVNILVQGVFCYICWTAFDSPDFDDDGIFGLRIWRWNSAHDVQNVNLLWPISLASRICGSDTSLALSGQQAAELALTERYRPEKTPWIGELMCLLCVLCLWTSVWGDAKDTFKMLRGVFACRGKESVLQPTEEGLKIQSLSPFRIALIVLTVVLRAAAFSNILAVGTVWLSYTTSVGNLLLNALALELVLRVDELLFTNLAPVRAKVVVRSCLPLPTPHSQICIGLDVTALLGNFMLFGALPVVYASLIYDTVDLVKQAEDALCGGVTNFVYNVDALGIVYIHDQMKAPNSPGFTKDDFDYNDIRIRALEDVIVGLPRAEWKYARYEPDLQALQGKHTKEILLLKDDLNPNCADLFVDGNSNSPLRAALNRAAANNVSFDVMCSSSSLQPYCYLTDGKAEKVVQLTKIFCPVSCGCSSPTGGTLMKSDCPEKCASQLEGRLKGMGTCEDVDVLSTSWWTTWMQEAAHFVDDKVLAQLTVFGCQALVGYPDLERDKYCSGQSEWNDLKPLAGVCPESCGCRSTTSAYTSYYCPSWCRNMPCPRDMCRVRNFLEPGTGMTIDDQGNSCRCSREDGACYQSECGRWSNQQDCAGDSACAWTGSVCGCPCNGNNFGNGCVCGTNYCSPSSSTEVRNHCFDDRGEEVTTNGTLCQRPCTGSVDNPVDRECACGFVSCAQDIGCEGEYTCGYPKCVISDSSDTDDINPCKCGDNTCYYQTSGCYNDDGVSDEDGRFCYPP